MIKVEIIGHHEYLVIGVGSSSAATPVLVYPAPLTQASRPTHLLMRATCTSLPTVPTGATQSLGSRDQLWLSIASYSQNSVFRFAADEITDGSRSPCPTTVTIVNGVRGPEGLAADGFGNLFVANAAGSGLGARTISVYPNLQGPALASAAPTLVYSGPSQPDTVETPPSPTHEAAGSDSQIPGVAAEASHCAGDTVVWLNYPTMVYHVPGQPYYGDTKDGGFVCRHDADAAGAHPSREDK